ncbi:MAG: alpha/beta hydrolase [Paracoccaceae bacterium]
MTALKGPERHAASGTARALVVLVHGYGADGDDLMGLAGPIAPHLPMAAFRAPNGPERSLVNPMGYQWFPIPFMDGSSEAEMIAGFRKAQTALATYLAAEMKSLKVSPEATVLVGFSQGTMMSLAVGPGVEPALAGIVGFSGRLAEPEVLKTAPSRPPVLLVHGDQDPVVPVEEMTKAEKGLTAAGFDVQTHVSEGVGHGIAPDGLGLLLGFLKDRLPSARG